MNKKIGFFFHIFIAPEQKKDNRREYNKIACRPFSEIYNDRDICTHAKCIVTEEINYCSFR